MEKLLVLLSSVVLLLSCSDDTEEYKPTLDYVGVVSTYEAGELGYGIITDYGQFLIPTKDDSDSLYSFNDRDRINYYVEFSSSEEYYKDTAEVTLLQYYVFDTYDVLTKSGGDAMVEDPIAVLDDNLWVTQEYMNIIYSYQQGDTPKEHAVNLVYYPDSVGNNGGVLLKLHHNANGDIEEVSSGNSLRIFDLTSVDVFANVTDSLNYTLKLNRGDFSGMDYFEGTYYAPIGLE